MKCTKPHTIQEELILLAAVNMVNMRVDESAERLLSKVLFSNNIISHRILNMAKDLNDQLIEIMKGKEFE